MKRLVAIFCLAALPAPNIFSAGGTGQSPGVVVKVDGALVERAKPGDAWRALKAGDKISADSMVVALPQAMLTSRNEAVGMKLMGDLGKRGPFPVYESAVQLKDPPAGVDLDVSLDRGILGLENRKKEGAAHVRIHVAGITAGLVLNEPGTKVGIEVYGRHLPGPAKFLEPDSKAKDEPRYHLFVIVVQGSITVKRPEHEMTLSAPPGPAVLQWDSTTGQVQIERLAKLPEFVTKPHSDQEKEHFAKVTKRLEAFVADGIDKSLASWLKSKDEDDRRGAVVVLGALDRLPQLAQCINDPEHADVRDQSITVVRHWLGRKPGQGTALYDFLVKDRKAPPNQAKNALHLLFGFTDQERMEPTTYEVLIEALNHMNLPVRELAHWHLVRLAPAGKDIAYDAAAPVEMRERAVAQWRALIPTGKLPPAPKK